jgi:hypothetical protein
LCGARKSPEIGANETSARGNAFKVSLDICCEILKIYTRTSQLVVFIRTQSNYAKTSSVKVRVELRTSSLREQFSFDLWDKWSCFAEL